MEIEFYWDPSSTNTYFAWHLLKPIAQQYRAQISPRSFNLGYVFRHHNYALTDEPKAKMRNRKRDLVRWAAHHQLPFRVPKQFPIKTSRILRAAVVMRAWQLETNFIDQVLNQYWSAGDHSVAEDPTLIEIAGALGVSKTAFRDALVSVECGQSVIDETQAGLDRGVFGAPTLVIEDEIYWGKDRMEFIERHLKEGKPALAPLAEENETET